MLLALKGWVLACREAVMRETRGAQRQLGLDGRVLDSLSSRHFPPAFPPLPSPPVTLSQ